MSKYFITPVVVAVLCWALVGIAVGGSDSPMHQNGDPDDSWANQRSDGGLELSIKVSPQTINSDSQAKTDWITVHTDIPYALVDTNTLELNGIPPALAYADDRGNLVAKFDIVMILEIAEPPAVELTLTGFTDDGVLFEGSDVVKVLDPLS